VNFVGTPSGEIGSGGGGMISYDFSIARSDVNIYDTSAKPVSRANIYAGVGYQVPFVNNTEANFQSAVGDRGQVMFALGIEGRLSNSVVGFMDLKFPTTTSAADEEGYSPVLTGGLGIKF